MEDFEAVYVATKDAVWRYLALMLRSPTEADEVSADVFERAYQAWVRNRAPSGPWLPWLLTIARRLVISRWRRARILTSLPIRTDETCHANSVFDDVETSIWLDQITSLLPRRQRDALFLRYLSDLDDRDVGLILGLSPSGVRSLISRAIATLRQHPEVWR